MRGRLAPAAQAPGCKLAGTRPGTALTTCFNEGIVIVWVDGHGRSQGRARGVITKPESLSTLIEHYLELKDWPRRFGNWLARRRLAAVTAVAKRRLENGQALDAGEFAAIKREYVHKGIITVRFHPEVQAWCEALTVDRLMRLGLEDSYHGVSGTRLALADTLSELLWAELNIEAGSISTADIPNTALARIFEAWAAQREGQLIEHLGDLQRHLAREVDTWH